MILQNTVNNLIEILDIVIVNVQVIGKMQYWKMANLEDKLVGARTLAKILL